MFTDGNAHMASPGTFTLAHVPGCGAACRLLEREMVDLPQIMLTDVDISTGDLILWLDKGKRLVVSIAKSTEVAD